jgi:hypothetical protein
MQDIHLDFTDGRAKFKRAHVRIWLSREETKIPENPMAASRLLSPYVEAQFFCTSVGRYWRVAPFMPALCPVIRRMGRFYRQAEISDAGTHFLTGASKMR